MDTSQLLDLFTVDSGRQDNKKKTVTPSNKTVSMKAILDELDELWDEKQYENEYNLETFMGSLKQ